MLSAHAAGNRVPRGDRLVVRETSTGGVEALRLTALTDLTTESDTRGQALASATVEAGWAAGLVLSIFLGAGGRSESECLESEFWRSL